METIGGKSTVGAMMELGRVGEKKTYPTTQIEFGAADKKWEQQIAAGNIKDERFAENSLRPKEASDTTAALNQLKNTMDGFIPASKNTLARLDNRLSPEKLEQMGFGRDRDWAEPLTQSVNGLREQIKMISEGLWEDGRHQDDSIREAIKSQIVDTALSKSEKEYLKRLADGFHHIRNMSLNYDAAAGDPAVWVATESKGGKVSDTEADRISFEHLRDQIQIYPQLAVLIEELDDEVVRNISNENFDISEFFKNNEFGKKFGLDGEPVWKRQYLCDIAFNWYRIIGFPDIRKFGNRTKQYKENMPSGVLSGFTKPDGASYKAAIKQPNCVIGLTPYFFLMDPLSLWSDILKNSKEVVAKVRVAINRTTKTEHSVANLGWRPAAWDLIDNLLTADAVGPEELNGKSLKNLDFSKVDDRLWDHFLYDKDLNGRDLLQKNNIKFAEKAMAARGALWTCLDVVNFNMDNIGKMFNAVGDLVRTEESDTLFNREKVYPILFQVLIQVGREAGLAGLPLNVKKDDLEFYLKAMRLKFKPIVVITDSEIKELKGYCKN